MSELAPTPYKSVREISDPYFEQLSKDANTRWLRKEGGYNVYGVVDKDLSNTTDRYLNEIANTPEGARHIQDIIREKGFTGEDATVKAATEFRDRILQSQNSRLHIQKVADPYDMYDAQLKGQMEGDGRRARMAAGNGDEKLPKEGTSREDQYRYGDYITKVQTPVTLRIGEKEVTGSYGRVSENLAKAFTNGVISKDMYNKAITKIHAQASASNKAWTDAPSDMHTVVFGVEDKGDTKLVNPITSTEQAYTPLSNLGSVRMIPMSVANNGLFIGDDATASPKGGQSKKDAAALNAISKSVIKSLTESGVGGVTLGKSFRGLGDLSGKSTGRMVAKATYHVPYSAYKAAIEAALIKQDRQFQDKHSLGELAKEVFGIGQDGTPGSHTMGRYNDNWNVWRNGEVKKSTSSGDPEVSGIEDMVDINVGIPFGASLNSIQSDRKFLKANSVGETDARYINDIHTETIAETDNSNFDN
jgi:hypothetical protein